MRTPPSIDANNLASSGKAGDFSLSDRAVNFDEQTLVQALSRRESRAFEILYDRYAAALFGIILRLVHERELAENLLLDAFLTIREKIDEYPKSGFLFFTWIASVARRLAIERGKLEKHQYSNCQAMTSRLKDVS